MKLWFWAIFINMFTFIAVITFVLHRGLNGAGLKVSLDEQRKTRMGGGGTAVGSTLSIFGVLHLDANTFSCV
jgi:hypothetical protein